MKKKAGASAGRRVCDLAREIALDERDRDQNGQPDPERENDLRRRRARAVQIGERQSQHRAARPAEPFGGQHDAGARGAKESKGGDRPADEPQRDGPVCRGQHGQRSEPEHQSRRRARRPASGTRRLARSTMSRNNAAGRHVADPGERPQRKDQRRQDARTTPPKPAAPDRARPAARPAARRRAAATRPPARARRAPAPRRCRQRASAMISMK